VVPLLLVAAYWWAHKDLYDLIYAVLIHNRLYVQQGYSPRAFVGTPAVSHYEQPIAASSALALISLTLYAAETWFGFRRKDKANLARTDQESAQMWIMAGLAIAVFFDVINTGLSGRNFHHYFQIPILTMTGQQRLPVL